MRNQVSPPRVGKKQDGTGLQTGPFAWYSRMLDTRPLLTKSVTSGILMGGGDMLCQYIKHDRQHPLTVTLSEEYEGSWKWGPQFQWDRERSFENALCVFLVFAPILHVWYNFIMKRKTLFSKILLNQIPFAFMGVMSLDLCAANGNEAFRESNREMLFDVAYNMRRAIGQAAEALTSLISGENSLDDVIDAFKVNPTEFPNYAAHLGTVGTPPVQDRSCQISSPLQQYVLFGLGCLCNIRLVHF